MIGLVDGNNFFVSCERVVNPKLNGKPVAVLSNNDGCCVSRSNEFKALGIPMGTPYFQLKAREMTEGLVFCSSNYELYGDLSRRIISILHDEAVDVEQYSIDEAFIFPPDDVTNDLMKYGLALRKKILTWVGIPCGVGFAPTKTLAKIANHIAKKSPSGVYVLPNDPSAILDELPVGEVWGIGRHMVAKLRARGILTAGQLARARESDLRAIGSVLTVRTAMELRGTPCVDDRDYEADPDSITYSRSFGNPVTSPDSIAESIAFFTSSAAVKLRKHGLLAAGCNIFAQFGSALEHRWTERTVTFPSPTDATNVMLREVSKYARLLYVPNERCRKSGIIFYGLEKAGIPQQLDLFSEIKTNESSKLYKVVDSLNARFGRGVVFSAAEGISGQREWEMKRGKVSPRATTRWDELLTVQ